MLPSFAEMGRPKRKIEKSECKNGNGLNPNPEFSFLIGYLFCQRFPRRNGLCSPQKAQPAGWAFLIPLRHSSFSPQSFAAQTFAGAPPYGLRRKAGIHFITPTQPLKPLGKAIPGRFCFCNNTLLPGCGTRVNDRHTGQHTSTIVNRHNAQL